MADADHGLMSIFRLTGRAVATSSPGAQTIGGRAHILHPAQEVPPRWSTVSVTCEDAALADAASTAFCLMSEAQIEAALGRIGGLPRAHLVTLDGKLVRLGPSG